MGRSRCSSERGGRARVGAALLLLVLTAGGTIAEESEAPVTSIAIVVGFESTIQGVSIDTLRELYLRRRRLWPDGERAAPVNLPADSAVRLEFSRRVLGRAPRDLVSYWRRMDFEGIRPPLVLKSPQAICAYVAVEHAAIGYMRPDDVDRRQCRILFVLASEPTGQLNPP